MWADAARSKNTNGPVAGVGAVRFSAENGKMRVPRHLFKPAEGGPWKSRGLKMPTHPEADIPIESVEFIGLDAAPRAASRKGKTSSVAKQLVRRLGVQRTTQHLSVGVQRLTQHMSQQVLLIILFSCIRCWLVYIPSRARSS